MLFFRNGAPASPGFQKGSCGTNSVFNGITSAGGGGGATYATPPGSAGGSGGGGGDFVPPPVFEFFHGLHEAHVALLNQIEKRESAVRVLLGNGNHQS